jgi:N-acylneuraminate cytidylyltransferase/CMP-N,N'-diacetyllegionaminic acid synthase
MKRLCTICARGGSQGVPGKNVRLLAGKPLLTHAVEQARASDLFDALAVSSDSPEILAVAGEAGVELLIERPAEMATHTAGKLPAIRHAVLAVEERLATRFEICVDLDATSPLRLPEDVRGAVALLEGRPDAANVITGTRARCSPYFNMVEPDEAGFVHLSKPLPGPVLRRQDAPRCFDMNASVYVWWRDRLVEDPRVFYEHTLLYEMPEERSVDIDTEVEFRLVEALWAARAEEAES